LDDDGAGADGDDFGARAVLLEEALLIGVFESVLPTHAMRVRS